MTTVDMIVLFGTLLFIVGYGTWKTRGSKNIQSYLKGDNQSRWLAIGISVMATQASAITFLSTPGQAYTDGMRFLQFYLGLPVAMIILSITFIPIYYKLKVYTAYEFLEKRFDLKTRTLAAGLFLMQRGLAAGITIFAPSIVLSQLLEWNLGATNLLIGVLVIIYTVSGGTKAVTQTQQYQMAVMMGGIILAGILTISYLPEEVGFNDALVVAGKMDKLNVINFEFDLSDRYNFWSGLTAALFLFMSYFGTDQSQVQRYLSGRSISESRMGLMMNGILKIPMQFIILFIGVMVFVFYQFQRPPVFFNQVQLEKIRQSEMAEEFKIIEDRYNQINQKKEDKIFQLLEKPHHKEEEALSREINMLEQEGAALRAEAKEVILRVNPEAEVNDRDYIFMTFVMDYLPVGLVGLLFAVIFSAAMSSTSSELNALASTTTVDIYKRSVNRKASDQHYVVLSKLFTLAWGIIAILFATYASLFENLIQLVNIVGSLFYGTILGIFLVAFYVREVGGRAVFTAALIAETVVLVCHFLTVMDVINIGYLWYNAIGCAITVIVGIIIQRFFPLDDRGDI